MNKVAITWYNAQWTRLQLHDIMHNGYKVAITWYNAQWTRLQLHDIMHNEQGCNYMI